jgi:hypothetical protein
MQVLPHCGHCVHEDAPDKVTANLCLKSKLCKKKSCTLRRSGSVPARLFARVMVSKLSVEVREVRGRMLCRIAVRSEFVSGGSPLITELVAYFIHSLLLFFVREI